MGLKTSISVCLWPLGQHSGRVDQSQDTRLPPSLRDRSSFKEPGISLLLLWGEEKRQIARSTENCLNTLSRITKSSCYVPATGTRCSLELELRQRLAWSNLCPGRQKGNAKSWILLLCAPFCVLPVSKCTGYPTSLPPMWLPHEELKKIWNDSLPLLWVVKEVT